MFRAVSKSTMERDFTMNMEKIKDVNPSVYDHLMTMESKSWCKAQFQVGLACEAVGNGMDE